MENQMKAGGLFENENGFIILSETQKEKGIEGGDSFRSKVVFLYKEKKGDVIKDTSEKSSYFSLYYDKCRYTRSINENGVISETSLFTRAHDEDFVRDAAKEFGCPICTEDDLEDRWEKENPPIGESREPRNVTLSFTRNFTTLKRGLHSARKLSMDMASLTSFLNHISVSSMYDIAKALVLNHAHSHSHELPTLELSPDYLRITAANGRHSLKIEELLGSGMTRMTWTIVAGQHGSIYQRTAKKHGWDAVEKE